VPEAEETAIRPVDNSVNHISQGARAHLRLKEKKNHVSIPSLFTLALKNIRGTEI
jgi:hypothetical protein